MLEVFLILIFLVLVGVLTYNSEMQTYRPGTNLAAAQIDLALCKTC